MKQFFNLKTSNFLLFLLIFNNTVHGQTINPSSISTNGTVNAIVQDSTSIYIGGTFSTVGYKSAGVALINSEGKNSIGFPSISTGVTVSISDGNGGWYIGGNFTYQGKNDLIHILSDNSLDVNFTFSPNTSSVVHAILFDGNTLFVGGDFTQLNGQNIRYLASINPLTGIVNANWNPNPNAKVSTIKKDGNTLYIGGTFSKIGDRTQNHFAAINVNTAQLIQSISTEREVYIINQDENSIYVGGRFATETGFTGENGFYTGRGSILTTASDIPEANFPQFGSILPNAIGSGSRVSIPDGSGGWYIGGFFTYLSYSNLIHVLSDNTIDSNFSPNPSWSVNDLVLDGDNLFVGGEFSEIGGQNISYLALLNATNGSVNTNWNPNPNNLIFTISKDGNKLYAGGNFTSLGGKENKYFAVVDTTTGAVIPSISTTGKVNVIKHDNDNIYVGGDFTGDCGYYTGDCALLPINVDIPIAEFPKLVGITLTTISDGNGGWYIGGNFDYQNKNNLIHILPDYSVDDLFAPNPNSVVRSLLLDGTSLIVGGSFTNVSGVNINNLAKINAITGQVDISWNPNPNSYVEVIAKIGNSYYIAGAFSLVASVPRNYLAGIDSLMGTLLPWNPNPNSTVTDIKVSGNELIVGGGFTTIGGQSRNRLAIIDLATGTPTAWNPNVNGTVNTILLNGTTVFAGGGFTTVGGQTRNRIAEIDLITGLATSLNPNSNGTINDLTMIGTTLVIGGNFSTIGGQTRNNLAALNTSDGSLLAWNPNSNGTINAIDTDGNNLCLTGNFSTLKAETRNRFLTISKSSNLISSLNLAPNSSVNAIELNGTKMYIGGGFSTIAGQSRSRIAEIDINTQLATSWNPNANTTVNCIKLVGSTVYVGGEFNSIGGQARKHLAAIDSTNGNASSWNPAPNNPVYGISYDGSKLNILGAFTLMKTVSRNKLLAISKTTGLITDWNPNPNSNGGAIEAIEVNGQTAYVSGNFTQIGGQQRNKIAEIDLITGSATGWNPNPNNYVYNIRFINGLVYVGGSFTSIGGQTRNYLAAINPTDGTATSWHPKPNAPVYDIKQAGQNVLISGNFSFTNSESRNNLCKISKVDNLIADWIPNPNNTVQTIELDGNKVYTGGLFTTIGGQSRNRIAAIDNQTGLASAWNPNANALVKTMKLSGNTLYVGGLFTTIGGQSRTNLAGIDTGTGAATTWSPNPNAIINKIGVSNGTLYAAGNFTTIAGQPRSRLASFTTADDLLTSWDPNVSGSINDLFITASSVYIGGSFNQVSGQNRNGLASFSKSNGALRNWKPILTGSVTAINTIGRYIYVGGNISSSGGQLCDGFTMIDANTGFPKLFYPSITGGNINTMSANRGELYLGGSFTGINLNSYGGLASISFGDNYFLPYISNVLPSSASVGAQTTISILGNGFVDGTTIRFTKQGQQDILVPLNKINIFDGIRLNAILNIEATVVTGLWNIIIEIPNENSIVLNNAFEFIAEEPTNIQTTIVGSNVYRPDVWQNYTIVVENKSNHDATGVPVFAALDPSVLVDCITEIHITDAQGNVVISNVNYDPMPIDGLFGVSGSTNVYDFLIANIPPGQTANINLRVKKSGTSPHNIRVWNDNPIYNTILNPAWNDCLDEILTALIGATPAGCAYGVFRAVVDPIIEAAKANDYSLKTKYGIGMLEALVGCVPLPTDTLRDRIFKRMFQTAGYVSTGESIISECLPLIPSNWPSQVIVNFVGSHDPNEKLGPAGIGVENYVTPTSSSPFVIKFENLPEATAPAQTVIIEDVIDSTVFDLTSFQLGFITLKDSIINIPAGLKHFETDVDLRPSNNIIARIVADFNQTTGLAKWTFTSIDPATLLETTAPLAGIIPPNVNAPEGEGAVMFSIKPIAAIGHDVLLKNKATIYFDTNEPIITNEWFNTSDIIKPQSQVTTVTQAQSGSSDIVLNWSGSDLGSGVRSYEIFYSINGGPFEILKSNITATSYTFTGNIDTSYSFFTIATDNVGNVEDLKTTGEAQITLGTKQNQFFKGVTIYPNPNKGNFTLFINSNYNETVDIEVTDLVGRNILSLSHILKSGENYIPININENGVYLINVNNQKSKVVKKVIIKN